jgi:tripartite-type tricarboxylate transporter receptor subunit TctC
MKLKIKFKKRVSVMMTFLLVIGVLLSGCSSEASNTGEGGGDDSAFYTGKSLELLVPFGAGGGTDTFARFIQPFLNEHVPGNPEVQTVNVPGGGSINGANEFVTIRKHDGLTALVTSASTHAPYLLGESTVKYDLKEMIPVAGLPTGGVVYSSPSTGVKEPKDLLSPKEDLIYAGISATGLDLVTLLSFEVLGAEVEPILGYDGRGPSRVAFQQGESNIDYQTSTAYLTSVIPMVEKGEAVPLYTFGQLNGEGEIVRDPAFPDLPSIKEVYVEIHGEKPSGEAWEAYKTFVGSSFSVQKVIWLQNDAPEKAVEALSKGAVEAAKDPEFQSKGEEVLGGYDLITGDNLDKVVKGMLNADKEVLDWVRNYLKEEHGIERLGG